MAEAAVRGVPSGTKAAASYRRAAGHRELEGYQGQMTPDATLYGKIKLGLYGLYVFIH